MRYFTFLSLSIILTNISYSQTHSANLDYYIEYHWSGADSIWIPVQKVLNVWNDNKAIERDSLNSEGGDNWSFLGKILNGYNDRGELIADTTLDPHLTIFIYSKNRQLEYDSHGQLSSETIQKWDNYQGVWNNADKHLYTYNTSEISKTDILLLWNSNNQTWDTVGKKIHYYNSRNKNIWERLVRYGRNNGKWNYQSEQYTVKKDSTANIITLLYLTKPGYNQPVDSNWYATITFDDEDRIIKWEIIDFLSGTPILQAFQYDSNNNLSETIQTVYSKSEKRWRNSARWEYHYIITGIDEPVSGDLSCALDIYPNPASESVVIDINFLKAGNCLVKIYNLQGEGIRTVSFDNSGAGLNRMQIDLSDFETGVYLVKTDTGDIQFTGKLLYIIK